MRWAAGGLIEAHVRLRAGAGRRLRQVMFTGDFLCGPPRAVADLEWRSGRAGRGGAGRRRAVFYDTASCYSERGIGGLRRALAAALARS